jgi:surface polysaccharide O-acyltransferase-like enzyme
MESKTAAPGKYAWADYLRIMATISVIILHISANILYENGADTNAKWWTANLYDGITRFCVPLFLMLTGALLLRKDQPVGAFLKSKFMRIVLPFIFWSLAYIAFDVRNRIAAGENLQAPDIAKWALLQLKNGSAYHLWYVYMLIGVYLFIPVIGKWARHSSSNGVFYFLVVWFAVLMLNQPYVQALDIRPNVELSYFTGYLGYVVLGYYLATRNFGNRMLVMVLSGVLIIGGTLVTIFGTYYDTVSTAKLSEQFYGYLTPNVLAVTIGLFLFLKHAVPAAAKTPRFIAFANRYSYGIYLAHILVLNEMGRTGWHFYEWNPVAGIPLNALTCFSVSLLLVFALNKIPLVKHVAG